MRIFLIFLMLRSLCLDLVGLIKKLLNQTKENISHSTLAIKVGHQVINFVNKSGKVLKMQKILMVGIIKHKSPPRIPTKDFLFEVAKYHIVVENEQRNNWITEKLIDCLATRTIQFIGVHQTSENTSTPMV